MMPSILVAFFVNSEDSLSIFHTRLKRNVTFFSISSPYPRSVTVYPMSDSIHRKVSSLWWPIIIIEKLTGNACFI